MAFYDPLALQQQQQQQQQQHPSHLIPQQQLHAQPHFQPSLQHLPGYGVAEMRTSLWMGELEPWMDENWIRAAWYNAGEQVGVKMIRDKYTGANAGYCFIEMASPAAAAKAINSLNGMLIPGSNKPFKLNWASGGGMASANGHSSGQEYSVFVGDLSPEVTEIMLVSKFQERYLSCRSAKIMTDASTGASRGYGFVRFGDESEQLRALHEMQGMYVGSRPIRISMATPKNKSSGNSHIAGINTGSSGVGPTVGMGTIGMGTMNVGMNMAPPTGYGFNSTATVGPIQPGNSSHVANQYSDPNNTTVFVGGLSGVSHEDELRNAFAMFGEITYVKIPPGKGCGFVQFVHRHSAEMAIQQLNGYQFGNSRVRLSWGRAQNDTKQQQPPPQQQQPMSPHAHGPSSSAIGPQSFRPAMQNQFVGIGNAPGRAIGPQPPGPPPPAFGAFPGMMAGTPPPPSHAPPMLGMMLTPPPTQRDMMEPRLHGDLHTRGYSDQKDAGVDRMDDSVGWRGSGAIYA